ncbi:MAG: class I SAM-dependent methyltransferase [Alphaproteobacteria bacterium]|nr:class I SAM-dependent methyltransferase [Alphaproteobacteria bacterium]
MTGFSSAWLKLREAADHRSRNAGLAEALSGRLALREKVSVTDIGCGTGSNLRGTADLLPDKQSWTLVDYDAGLLESARVELAAWADAAHAAGGELRLEKGHKRITVAFRQADLSADLDAALGETCDLVTAAAFFDLASEAFIRRFAKAVAERRAVFYTVLTYNGISRWQPHHPADNAVTSAFHRHQLTDKGFGVAAGPMAPIHLSDQFQFAEYSVQEGDSPWELGRGDQALMDEVQAGHAAAVTEIGGIDAAPLHSWASRQLSGVYIGHTDTLAMPV